ncbi:ADP-ribosylglycohydrolase family protein [Streptomyces hydrogenans]|uniref:ADP-ribosylglycohydrolase family protein n=1 Tax=Streptomyces hydrogenans TaxID=1873719 RepID=UPI00167E41B0|nr:ADP-ribosylglycohydrolase family protein [Streptomyces hydrogenans]GHG01341.1 ADP-ribosylglycohydrolase [Streptomyces hydrogenans]
MTTTAAAVWGRTEQQDFRSRVRGCLLGAAVGDAVGAGVHERTLKEIRAEHGEAGLAEPPDGTLPVTAATQMSLFTLDGLIRAHVRRDTGVWHPPSDVHRAHLRWAATQRDWGPDERRRDNGWLGRQEWLYARRRPARACLTGLGDERLGTLDQPKNPDADDSGALARSAPLGLLVGWEPQLVCQLAVECAAQTHGAPAATLADGARAVTADGVARGASVEAAAGTALGLLAAHPGHEPVTEALTRALAAVREGVPDADRVTALGAGEDRAEGQLAAAVYCALVGEDVRHGLRLAVNHDGPSAVTAAVTGALLGAQHGETALPPAWLAALEGRATLLELSDDFAMELTQSSTLHTPTWHTRYPTS